MSRVTSNVFRDVRLQQERSVNLAARRALRGADRVDTSLGSPLERAMSFLRNTIAQSPRFGEEFTVISIDTEPQDPDMFWLHCSDGRTIILTVEVEEP